MNKKDLAEIKSFARPPAKVEMVMEAVMILKNSEPTWAESKRQLGDVNFINTVSDNVAAVVHRFILLVSQTNKHCTDLISSFETLTKIIYRIEFYEQ